MFKWAACLLLALAGMASMPVAAQDMLQADHTAIEGRIAAFDKMMKEGRTGDSLEFVSPHLLNTTAQKFGVSASELKAFVAEQIATITKNVKFVSFRMNLNAGTVGVTPDKARQYVLIPTETVIELPEAKPLLSKTTTLAFNDNGVWYLVRIDSAEQVLLLREAYPEFTGVEFPTGSTTPVD